MRGHLATLSLVLLAALPPRLYAAEQVQGRIQMIQPNLSQGLVYVHLQGYPQLNGGSCPEQFFVGKMDDTNFKTFVYPVLLAAKVADAEIVLRVSGCHLAYPLIVSVEYSPRQ